MNIQEHKECKLIYTSLDPYAQAGPYDLTKVDESYLNPSTLLSIPGRCEE